MRKTQLTILIGITVLSTLRLTAQQLAENLHVTPKPSFEVVSLHLMKRDDVHPEHIDNPWRRGYLKAVNVSLRSLMEVAYDIPDLRMFGGPTWITSQRFSIEAKADGKLDEQLATLSYEQAKQAKRKMIAALLVEKFQLAVHTDTKVMPVYVLIVAKGGAKLSGRKLGDGSQSAGDQLIEVHPGSYSIQVLAYELSWRVGRPVLDRTGLPYKEALTLRWRGDDEDSNAPSLFPAIQEQLGLKLEGTRDSVPVLLIDHAEIPGED